MAQDPRAERTWLVWDRRWGRGQGVHWADTEVHETDVGDTEVRRAPGEGLGHAGGTEVHEDPGGGRKAKVTCCCPCGPVRVTLFP